MSTDLAPPPATVRDRHFVVVWQRPDRTFVPVGQLDVSRDGRGTTHSRFRYRPDVGGEAEFEPLLAFPDLDAVYEREGELFPFLANRVMSPRRPDFDQYVTALGLSVSEADPLEILARSGGERATDTIHLVPFPERHGDVEWRHFMVSGVRHQPGAQDRIARLEEGDALQLRAEPDNPENPAAMLLDLEHGQPVGWLPNYLLPEFHAHVEAGNTPTVYVVKANGPEVPWHVRLLCRLEFDLA